MLWSHGVCLLIFVAKVWSMYSLVVGQATPVPGEAVYMSNHHLLYHCGCEHVGVEYLLCCARVWDGCHVHIDVLRPRRSI